MPKKNFFEKNPKIILLAINLVFLLIIFWIADLKIFQDSTESEKYSLIDKVSYDIRCQGKRNINLRENLPNLDELRFPTYDQNAKYRFQTDENGFVKPSKIHQNSDLNIFFLGGSTTECEMVDEELRFPYLTGRILEEKTKLKINSYNAGKSGNNSIHSLNNFINKVIPLNPNIVVRMENINDLSTLLYESTYWNKNRSRSNLGCFNKNSTSFRNFNNEWAESPFRDKIFDPKHQEKIKLEQRKIINLFIASVKASGATPVLMTQANKIDQTVDFSNGSKDEKFNQTYRQLYSDFQEITRQAAKENGVLLIDLEKEIPQRDEYLYDSVHFTNEGSKLAAKIISKNLQKYVTN